MIFLESLTEHASHAWRALEIAGLVPDDVKTAFWESQPMPRHEPGAAWYHLWALIEYLQRWPVAVDPGGCSICGGENECRNIGGLLTQEPLTKDDWKEVLLFMTNVEMPFIHRTIEKARGRVKKS